MFFFCKHKWLGVVFATLFLFLASTDVTAQSKFERLREWSSASGKFKIQAKISLLKNDIVTIEKEDGTTSTIPVTKLSQEDQDFIEDYKKAAFTKVKSDARESIFAKDIVRFYSIYLDQGFATPEQEKFAKQKIAEFKVAAEKEGIILGNEIVAEPVLLQRQKEAEDKIDLWLDAKRGDEDKLLKLAQKEDPTSLEPAILMALYEELHEANFKVSQRYLLDNVKRGRRYLSILSETDKENLVVTLNNLAVSYARTDQLPKALKMWTEADQLADYELPTNVKYNVAKLWRMLNSRFSGLKTDRKSTSAIEEFVKTTDSNGNRGGWKILFPKSREGQLRRGLDFVLANRVAQKVRGDYIEDTRCVYCAGHSIIDCPNRKCKNGKVQKAVKGWRKVKSPDGTVLKTSYGTIRVDWIRCTACNGKSQIDCPCCHEGMQER